ncbi:TRAP transporter small permease [Desulfocurvus sp. DL9XJH121]
MLDRLEKLMTALAAACLLGMALVTGCDVLGRAAWNTPLFGSEEIVTILATLALGLSLPYAHVQRVHIGVEIVTRRLSRRVRNRLALGTDLAACALFCLVTWRMTLYAGTLKRSGEVSMNLELPEYFVVYALAFGFAVFSVRILRDVLTLFSKDGI